MPVVVVLEAIRVDREDAQGSTAFHALLVYIRQMQVQPTAVADRRQTIDVRHFIQLAIGIGQGLGAFSDGRFELSSLLQQAASSSRNGSAINLRQTAIRSQAVSA